MAAMQPEFEDEDPINPFDFWGGADFKLKIKKVAGFWNYDSSEFARPSALLDGDDDALEVVWKKQYSLQELVSDSQFKSYDELKKRLDNVLGAAPTRSRVDEEVEDEEDFRGPVKDLDEDLSNQLNNLSRQPVTASVRVDEDEDDALSYFQKLAEE